jgi:hypothetical protein
MIGPSEALLLQHGPGHLLRRGPRATAELLAEVRECTVSMSMIFRSFAECHHLTSALIHAAGHDRFVTSAIFIMRNER